jgi:hypothetical protein
MLTVIALYIEPKGGNEHHGERAFWAWEREGERYCERFWTSVRRHVPHAHRLTLLTDAPHRFDGWGLDVVPLAFPGNGWWSKLEAFSPTVSWGRCWYSDLDNVLLGGIDEYLELPARPMVMLEDRHYPGMANGSNLLFEADHAAIRGIWREYLTNPRAIEREFSKWPHASDQAFIAHRLRTRGFPPVYAQHHLPPGYFLSGRDEIEQGADWSACRVVFGAGSHKPHESRHPVYQAWQAVPA